jgi:hypothetical protein
VATDETQTEHLRNTNLELYFQTNSFGIRNLLIYNIYKFYFVIIKKLFQTHAGLKQ